MERSHFRTAARGVRIRFDGTKPISGTLRSASPVTGALSNFAKRTQFQGDHANVNGKNRRKMRILRNEPDPALLQAAGSPGTPGPSIAEAH